MLKEAQRAVSKFMLDRGFSIAEQLCPGVVQEDATPDDELGELFVTLSALSARMKRIASRADDKRVQRAYLMLEELTETIAALSNYDEVELADGLADLVYVVLGTAAQYRIPLWTVFEAVHRSNMTKGRGTDTDRLLKADKGAGYVPADVGRAVEIGRAELIEEMIQGDAR